MAIWLRAIFLPPANILTLMIFGGALVWTIWAYIAPQFVREFSSLDRILRGGSFFLYLALFAVVVARSIALFKRRPTSAWCNFAAACTFGIFIFLFRTLEVGLIPFKDGPHSDIATIYDQRREKFSPSAPRVVNSSPRLVALEGQCRPPGDCRCWLLLDPQHRSNVEQELSRRRHHPTAQVSAFGGDRSWTLCPQDEPHLAFATVDVRPINADAYAVLGCSE